MYTIEDLTNLKEALAIGATTVTVQGRSITYRSLNDMIRIIKIISDELAANEALTENTSTVIATFDKKGRKC